MKAIIIGGGAAGLFAAGFLAKAGVDPREVRERTGEIVAATLADPCCATNPIKVEDYLVRRLLDEVTGHG